MGFTKRGVVAWMLLLLTMLFAGASSAMETGLDVPSLLRRPGVKLVAVEFYADWCKPCMAAVPKWKALHEKYRAKGLHLVVVSVGEQGGCSSPGWNPDLIVCDLETSIQRRLGANSLPQAFLWNWQGQMLASHASVEQIETAIERYFTETPRILVSDPKDENGTPISDGAIVREQVRSELTKLAKFDLVASDAELATLRELRQRSYMAAFDESLVCELGAQVSANSELKIKLLPLAAGRRKLLLQLYSVEQGCLKAASDAPVDGDDTVPAIFTAVSSLVEQLVGKTAGLVAPAPVSAAAPVEKKAVPASPPPSSEPGRIELSSTPTGATLVFDGENAGTTPFERPVRPGTHKLILHFDDYKEAHKTAEVKPGEATAISLALNRVLPMKPYVEDVIDRATQEQEKEIGFKVGRLSIHPGLSLTNIYDTNVRLQSKYNEVYQQIVRDDIIRILGSIKLEYPDPRVAFALDGNVSYSRYLGIDDKSTKNLSSVAGAARLALTFFRESVLGFTVSDEFLRSDTFQQLGIMTLHGRIHNTALARFQIEPESGRSRFFLGYTNDLERYDGQSNITQVGLEHTSNRSQNWLQHTGIFEAQFKVHTDIYLFAHTSFGWRDYWQYSSADNRADGNLTINTKSPNAMPFRIEAGVMGRLVPKLLFHAALGYGNSFSAHFQKFNSVISKVDLTGEFTKRTALRGGFERDYQPLTTFSYLVNNKIYAEVKQWLLNDSIKLHLHASYNFIQYGKPDEGIALAPSALTPISHLAAGRMDREFTLTPSFRYDFLKWLSATLAYTFTLHSTDYSVSRTMISNGALTRSVTYYDYLKHEFAGTLTISY